MGAQVILVTGPAGSGKTRRLLGEYRRALAAGPIGCALWLAPARRNIQQLRHVLLEDNLGACFSPQCRTFGQFAIQTLDAAATPLRPLNRLGQREILRRLSVDAERDGKLDHFRPIADTPGFLDLLTRFIRDLKRLEVWPEDFAAHAASRPIRGETKLAELAGLYAGYQDVLNAHGLFDPEGRFWAARAILRDGQTRPWQRVREVFIDGFTDFTRTEHEILEILAERSQRLVISLPTEGEPQRADLFAKTEATRAELQRRHKTAVVEQLDRSGKPNGNSGKLDGNSVKPDGRSGKLDGRSGKPDWPALAFLEEHLFRPPASVPPAPPLDRIELIVAASVRDEIESIAARVKRLLVQGDAGPDSGGLPCGSLSTGSLSTGSLSENGSPARVRCDEILVVFRSLDAAAELVREVFLEYGVPLAVESSRPLARSGILSAMTALLRLEREGWGYRQLLAVLANSYLRPDWSQADGDGLMAAAALTRTLQIPRGRRELLSQAVRRKNRLDRAASAPLGETARPPHGQAASELHRREATQGLAILERLAAALAALPERASIGRWAEALEELARETGLAPRDATLDAGREASRGAGPSPDAPAWEAALAALRGAEQLTDWLGSPDRQIDREEFWTLWQDILRLEPLPESEDETGRVRVLTAPSARGLSADYVFLAGLGEQSFPLAGGEHSLLNDAEAADLAAAGLPLPARSDRGRDEMLLFYEALTRARRRLFLSYAALDAKAQPLMPSPYLYELAAICGDRWPARSGPLHLSPLPGYETPLCLRDARLLAVARAQREQDAGLLAEILRRGEDGLPAPVPRAAPSGLARNLWQGLLAAEARRRRAGFGEFEGIFTSDAARQTLAARFGPLALWSASQLEQYVACPFAFFMNRILGLEPLAEIDLSVDYQRRGLALHGALAGLHRLANARAGGPAPLGDAAQILADAQELLQDLCAPRGEATPLDRALREIDRRLLETAIENYARQHEKYETQMAKAADGLRPAYFEVAFGSSASKLVGEVQIAAEADAERRAAVASDPNAEPNAEPEDTADPLSTSEPFRFDCGEETVLLRGRIDRIDIAQAGEALLFNVLDYKSGKSGRYGTKAVEAGLALQLPLYALAASDLLLAGRNATPLQAGYWFVKGAGYGAALKCHEVSGGQLQSTETWLAFRRQLAAWVLGAVRGVRGGQFPVYSRDDECTSRCPYGTVCRIQQVRSLEKMWPPIAAQEARP